MSRGFTLPELLVAMLLSLLLISGALHLFGVASSAYRTLEIVAGLEERAAFALQALQDDIRLAGFEQPGMPDEPLTARCNATDVSSWAFAIESVTAAAGAAALPCPLFAGAVPDSDALIIRHDDPQQAVRSRQVHAWYVDRGSSETGLPSLRRQTLLPNGSLQNQEIMPGVERLQVMLAVDTDADGRVDGLQPAGPVTGNVRGVQVTLGLRADAREAGIGGDGLRRLEAQRFVAVRNAGAG